MDTISADFTLDDGFGAEVAELEQEMKGLKLAAVGAESGDEGGEEGVEELGNMIQKLQAIKDTGADMPASERRIFAAKAMKDVMKAL